MSNTWLISTLLVACAAPQATQTATTPTPAPSVSITVWSRYRDFGDHGISANGRTFTRANSAWTARECTDKGCGEPAPVANALWSALDAIKDPTVYCEKTPEVCRAIAVEVPAPKTIVVVWSTYSDYSGHGFNGNGRFYARDGAGWSSIDCDVSHNADPEAGPNNHRETCTTRVAVPEALWSSVEAIAPRPGYEENDVVCSKVPDVCAALGVPNKPIR